MVVSVACFIIPGYAVYAYFGNALIGLGVGVACGFMPFGWIIFMRNRRFDKFQEGLPEALDLMVNALRAGHSLIASMGWWRAKLPILSGRIQNLL